MVVQTTHARRTKIFAKNCKEAFVAQIFGEGLYVLTICAHGFLWLQV
jgi:hypothetical protein